MKKFLKEIYLENKFNENAHVITNCFKLINLNNPDAVDSYKSKLFIYWTYKKAIRQNFLSEKQMMNQNKSEKEKSEEVRK